MDRFVVSPASSPSAADPGSGADDAGAAASAAAAAASAVQQQQQQHQQHQPDAPAPPAASDEVQVVDTAVDPSRVSVKEAKLTRVQTEARKSKPSGASA